MKSMTFEAVFEEEHAKTTITANRRHIWDITDVIKVYNAQCEAGEDFVVKQIEDSGEKAIFEGFIPGQGPYNAFYPSSLAVQYSAGEIQFKLEQEQIYEEGTFANGINPMMSSSIEDTLVFSFRNLCGLLDIRLKGNAKIDAIVLEDNDTSFALWGTGRKSFSGGEFTLTNTSPEKNRITLRFPQPVQLSESGNEFVFVLPDGALAKGFSANVLDSAGESIGSFGTTKNVNVINRSKIRVMPSKTISTSKIYYEDDISADDRFLSLGFDDFRGTDFSWVIPMLNAHSAHSNFNMPINSYNGATSGDISRVNTVISGGHEVGDHTVCHHQRWMTMPLLNGQNPETPDGNQVPFPSNSQFRDDRGDGKNFFGYLLTSTPSGSLGYQSPPISTQWRYLSDSQCQDLRNYYSLYGNSSFLAIYDMLSNKYLGTSGSSFGSWDDKKGCYTRGIFTDCKTSQNHEVWERISAVDIAYFKNELNLYGMRTWSLPGSANADFLYYKDGKSYYDSECTKRSWCTARFESSYLKDGSGQPKNRSWVEVLREYGYNNSHDMRKIDVSTMMSRGLIYNATLSRIDALPYPRYHNAPVHFERRSAFTNAFFTGTGSKAQQMYDYRASGQDGFFTAIEGLREMCSNGIVACGNTDTDDSESMKNYLEGILDYCNATGVKVVNEQEAMDICFKHTIQEGNLIYNPLFRNTAKEFMPGANVPSNPDGYVGNCSVGEDSGQPTLKTAGQVIYRHFGIPLGKIKYVVYAKGAGTVKIYEIRNDSPLNTLDTRYECGTIEVASPESFTRYSMQIYLPNNPVTQYEQMYEGLGNKICGLLIVYSSGLEIMHIELEKCGSVIITGPGNGETYGEVNGEW